ncbi:hypothetical protein [Paraburkholderia caribensis]|uniref:hypothetical protein n=1 Tax=Paraburkholderia caribensis TaxID=75105 RepID=UPI00285E0D8D|nr:hypothetical protein [Paraburkholderia caribensis]MDR6380573.1 hypothetical protein [Paraburkholderia caribensis]
MLNACVPVDPAIDPARMIEPPIRGGELTDTSLIARRVASLDWGTYAGAGYMRSRKLPKSFRKSKSSATDGPLFFVVLSSYADP